MNYILFDEYATRQSLLPFTHTRPLGDIRCGILTMRERWEMLLGDHTSTLTEPYLQPVFPLRTAEDNILVNGAFFATPELIAAVTELPRNSRLVQGADVLAIHMEDGDLSLASLAENIASLNPAPFEPPLFRLARVWDIFSMNDRAIREDFALLTNDRHSAPIPDGVTVSGKEALFIEPGALLQPGTVINAASGPVYIGAGAEVMEGCLLRGPLAVCDGAIIKMGAKVYGATTIGPGCRAGGEISNAVFFANSNKGHDGFLGNAVIGEWCNLGADTNCSNLKNNYDEVKIWDEYRNKSQKTGLTFCGLLMGDHSKCGINTMFNTGTVAGVSCNIYGAGFPEKFVPSFAWGGSEGMVTYSFIKAMETARRMMARRSRELSAEEEAVYRHVFDATSAQRTIFLNS